MPRSGEVADITVKILKEIRDEAKKTNERLNQTNERLNQTNERLDLMRGEMREGFDTLGQRIDNLLLGEHRREHEELQHRVALIEDHLGLSDG